jgi:acyl-CoA-binding protein
VVFKQLYGYYKVVTVGKVDTAKPSLWDLRGRAKWDAWKEVETTPAETAMQVYIETVEKANIGWNRDQLDDDDNDDDDDGGASANIEDDAEKKVFFFKKEDMLIRISKLIYLI